MRVLLVEDEALVAADLRFTLLKLGHTVVATAANGELAVRLARELRPELVLMDIHLQGVMDGIEVAGQIAPQIPVVYLTASADDATLQRAKSSAPFGYLIKPFDDRSLQTTIEIAAYQHSLERALYASEQRFAATLKSISDGVIVTDTEGRIVFMNSVAAQLTGWGEDEALGEALSRLCHLIDESSNRAATDLVGAVLRTREPAEQSEPTLLLDRYGKATAIENRAGPIWDANGSLTGVVLVLRDVTLRRRAEEQRLALERQQLEGQKLESLRLLTRSVGSKFNHLLQIILGNVALAHDGLGLDPWLHERLALIERAATQANELTTQLLAYVGEGHMMMRPLDINTLIAELSDTLRQTAAGRVTVRFLRDPSLPPVTADPTQLALVVRQLVVNAAEAIGTGHGKLTITTSARYVESDELATAYLAPELPGGWYVLLEVADTGSGMQTTTLAHIFEPFFTTKTTGRGLGLAAVLGIVTRHHGAIRVVSSPETGTQCTVFLPCQAPTVERRQRVVGQPELLEGARRTM